jgi:hypothetical protein
MIQKIANLRSLIQSIKAGYNVAAIDKRAVDMVVNTLGDLLSNGKIELLDNLIRNGAVYADGDKVYIDIDWTKLVQKPEQMGGE